MTRHRVRLGCLQPGCTGKLGKIRFGEFEPEAGVRIQIVLNRSCIETWCPVCGAHRRIIADSVVWGPSRREIKL